MASRPQSSGIEGPLSQLPKIQTALPARTRQDTFSATPWASKKQPNPALLDAKTTASTRVHQRIVLADPVAFLYLEEDSSTTVIERSRSLHGYQCYIVEQWVCSRNHPTFIIINYTGDEKDTIKVGILSVPADETAWSPRLKVYFKVLSEYHARRRETPLGYCMVTNLSSVPSALCLIQAPEGDPKKCKEQFAVNENLKRLGCSGRVGLTLAEPNAATRAKFHQLYRTSEKIPLEASVIELVKLCQAALMLFDQLEPDYVDGLFCDVTEKSIRDWWAIIGAELYNIEPGDGMLGPTTVSALLGTLIGARNRLHAYGAPVAKDVFDIEATKKAIAQFQRSAKLRKTRRLDRQTLLALHKATAKQASGEGWTVPKAVKSTVAELSGKGGEMVMEMVGRDKARIADVETVDFGTFVTLISGQHAKWLWQGKDRKHTTRDFFKDSPRDFLNHQDDTRKSYEEDEDEEEDGNTQERQSYESMQSDQDPFTARTRSSTLQSQGSVSKSSVLGRAKDRLKGAVGARHSSTRSRDKNDANTTIRNSQDSRDSLESARISAKDFGGEVADFEVPEQLVEQPAEEEAAEASDNKEKVGKNSPAVILQKDSTPEEHGSGLQDNNNAYKNGRRITTPSGLDTKLERVLSNTSTGSKLAADDPDLPLGFPADDRLGSRIGPLLRETLSSTALSNGKVPDNQYLISHLPTRLSFSAAEDAVLHRSFLVTSQDFHDKAVGAERLSPTQAEGAVSGHEKSDPSPREQLMDLLLAADHARRLRAQIASIDAHIGVPLKEHVARVSQLNDMAAEDLSQLRALVRQRQSEAEQMGDGARELVREERARLAEGLRDVETQGAKLEYELGNLRGTVEELEGAVDEFDRQVRFTEARVEELVRGSEKEGLVEWLVRKCFGVTKQTETGTELGRTASMASSAISSSAASTVSSAASIAAIAS